MIDRLKHVLIDEVDYPIAFSLNVLEVVQTECGSLEKWENEMQPKKGEPVFKTVLFTFKEMINEGIDIENERKNESRPFITHKQAGRLVTALGFLEAGKLIREVSAASVRSNKDPNS